MHVLTVANLKGGAGKTAASTNLLAVLGGAGLRTLLVDCDFQGDATTTFNVELGGEDITLAELLDRRSEFPEGMVPITEQTGLIPAADDLTSVVQKLGQKGTYNALLGLLEGADAGEWDVAILDTRPEPGHLTLAALKLADVVVSPLNAQDGHSVKNAGTLANLIADDLENPAPFRLFLSRTTPPRKGWRRRLAHGAIEDAAQERWGSALLDVSVPEDANIHGATLKQLPVTVTAPDSLAASAYRRLGDHLIPFLTES